MLQVAEVEKESDPMKEKLRSDRRATEKFDEKVDEWKVRHFYQYSPLNQELKHCVTYVYLIAHTTTLHLSMHSPLLSSNV